MSIINITLAPRPSMGDPLRKHVTVSEAANILAVSESTIRRAARRAGVRKIAGQTVHGGIVVSGVVQHKDGPVQQSSVPLVICYSA